MLIARELSITLPDSETFIPEFGLCLPPELTLEFRLPVLRHLSPIHEFDTTINLSDGIPIPQKGDDFNLPEYGEQFFGGGGDIDIESYGTGGAGGAELGSWRGSGGFDDEFQLVDDTEYLDLYLSLSRIVSFPLWSEMARLMVVVLIHRGREERREIMEVRRERDIVPLVPTTKSNGT